MVRTHLLWPALAALFSIGAQAAGFAPVASAGTATPLASPGLAAAASRATPAAATAEADTTTRTLWLCSLSERLTQLICVADQDPAEAGPSERPDAAAGADTAPPVTAEVRGTRFPLDPRRLWVVDLWTPPSTATDVAVLARATLCYRSAHCEVQLNLPDLRGSAGQPATQQLTQRWRSR